MTRKSDSVTIREVAKEAGVSVATVSRYINQTAGVSEDVAERLRQVMAELRYVPHATARNLATQRTHSVGLLLPYNIYGDFFAPLLRGIEEVTVETGMNLLISSRQIGMDGHKAPALGPHNTDGLLVFVDSLTDDELVHYYKMNFPMVLIHRTPPPNLTIPYITVENKAATKKIIDHVIECHHRCKIVFLRGPEHQEDSYWREMGYRASLEAHGIPFDAQLVQTGDFDRDVAHTTILELALAGVSFDAVFAGNDEAAVGVLTALRETDKKVPGDVAVIGFDDLNRTLQFITPPLTTVRAPTEEVGRVATRLLINLISGGQADPVTLLPTEIIIRQSCGC